MNEYQLTNETKSKRHNKDENKVSILTENTPKYTDIDKIKLKILKKDKNDIIHNFKVSSEMISNKLVNDKSVTNNALPLFYDIKKKINLKFSNIFNLNHKSNILKNYITNCENNQIENPVKIRIHSLKQYENSNFIDKKSSYVKTSNEKLVNSNNKDKIKVKLSQKEISRFKFENDLDIVKSKSDVKIKRLGSQKIIKLDKDSDYTYTHNNRNRNEELNTNSNIKLESIADELNVENEKMKYENKKDSNNNLTKEFNISEENIEKLIRKSSFANKRKISNLEISNFVKIENDGLDNSLEIINKDNKKSIKFNLVKNDNRDIIVGINNNGINLEKIIENRMKNKKLNNSSSMKLFYPLFVNKNDEKCHFIKKEILKDEEFNKNTYSHYNIHNIKEKLNRSNRSLININTDKSKNENITFKREILNNIKIDLEKHNETMFYEHHLFKDVYIYIKPVKITISNFSELNFYSKDFQLPYDISYLLYFLSISEIALVISLFIYETKPGKFNNTKFDINEAFKLLDSIYHNFSHYDKHEKSINDYIISKLEEKKQGNINQIKFFLKSNDQIFDIIINTPRISIRSKTNSYIKLLSSDKFNQIFKSDKLIWHYLIIDDILNYKNFRDCFIKHELSEYYKRYKNQWNFISNQNNIDNIVVNLTRKEKKKSSNYNNDSYMNDEEYQGIPILIDKYYVDIENNELENLYIYFETLQNKKKNIGNTSDLNNDRTYLGKLHVKIIFGSLLSVSSKYFSGKIMFNLINSRKIKLLQFKLDLKSILLKFVKYDVIPIKSASSNSYSDGYNIKSTEIKKNDEGKKLESTFNLYKKTLVRKETMKSMKSVNLSNKDDNNTNTNIYQISNNNSKKSNPLIFYNHLASKKNSVYNHNKNFNAIGNNTNIHRSFLEVNNSNVSSTRFSMNNNFFPSVNKAKNLKKSMILKSKRSKYTNEDTKSFEFTEEKDETLIEENIMNSIQFDISDINSLNIDNLERNVQNKINSKIRLNDESNDQLIFEENLIKYYFKGLYQIEFAIDRESEIKYESEDISKLSLIEINKWKEVI